MRSASASMSVAGACRLLQAGTRFTTQQPSFCRLATQSVCKVQQLQMTHRAAMQHGRSSLAIAAGPASLDGVSSTKNLGAGSLSHQSSKRDFAVMSAADEGTHGDASSARRATRSQLDQFFTTLSKEKNIATMQNCDEADVVILEDVAEYGRRWIGYCYYTEEDVRCLATGGCLDLTCKTREDAPATSISEVAQRVYATARACNLPIELSWKSNERADFEIAGLDPKEFAKELALLGGRYLVTTDDDDIEIQ